MPRTPTLSPELLNAALQGLETQRQKIEDQIGEVRRLLGGRGPGRRAAKAAPEAAEAKPARKKRHMSAAAKARIREAQKKRWAEFRKKKAQGA